MRSLVQGWAGKGLLQFHVFLERLGRKLPGAFKFAAWDEKGKLLPLPGFMAIPGRRMMEEVVRRFFSVPNPVPPSGISVPKGSQLALFQTCFGKDVPLDPILALKNGGLEARINDKPGFVFQWSTGRRSPGEGGIAGVLVFVDTVSLPRDFWTRTGLAMERRRIAGESSTVMTVHFAKPERGRKGSGFRNLLLRKFFQRNERHFEVGNWLATSVDFPPDQFLRAFVLSDLSILRKHTESARTLAIAAFLLAILIFTRFRFQDRLLDFLGSSFRRRIAGFFLLAVFFPTAGFVLLAGRIREIEGDKLRVECFQRLRTAASLLSTRGSAFPAIYTEVLERRLRNSIHTGISFSEVAGELEKLVRAGALSNFYLSDSTGDPAFSMNSPVTGKFEYLMKGVLKLSFQSSADEMAAMRVPENEMKILSVGRMNPSTVGQRTLYVLDVGIKRGGDFRLAQLGIWAEALERKFARREIRRMTAVSERAGREGPAFPLFCEFLFPGGVIPRGSPLPTILRHQTLAGLPGESKAVEGEFDRSGAPFLFHSPERSAFRWIRPVLQASRKPIDERKRERSLQILEGAALCMWLSVLLGVLLARGLLDPVGSLDEAVGRIRSGNLDIRLPGGGENEIGRLNDSFNAMVSGLRERELMRGFVSGSVLSAVSDETVHQARKGELRRVTVLFSHIRNFHGISSGVTPGETFAILNGFFAGAERCVRAFDGEVDKFFGEALMAVFLGDRQERNAVRASLAIRDFLSHFNASRQEEGLFPVKVGIGLNTGQAMMGDVGSLKRKDLTVIGDTVNTAARLETLAEGEEVCGIVLSLETVSPVKDQVRVEDLGLRKVKGKEIPLAVFRLTMWTGEIQ